MFSSRLESLTRFSISWGGTFGKGIFLYVYMYICLFIFYKKRAPAKVQSGRLLLCILRPTGFFSSNHLELSSLTHAHSYLPGVMIWECQLRYQLVVTSVQWHNNTPSLLAHTILSFLLQFSLYLLFISCHGVCVFMLLLLIHSNVTDVSIHFQVLM